MAADWVVVVETVVSPSEPPLDVGTLRRALAALPDVSPVGLHASDRVAVQLRIAASGEAEAVFVALTRWRRAVETVGGPPPAVVRTEVLTLEEFERDCVRAYSEPALAGEGGADEPRTTDARLADRLLREVFHDPLTELATRNLFVDDLHHALVDGRRTGAVHAVVVVGLDGVRAVNEGCGRFGFDEVVAGAAARLRATLGPNRVVGRIGDHHFAVLLERTSKDGAVAVMEEVVETLSQPMIVTTGAKVAVPAHAGMALSEPGVDGDRLLANATAAMLAAKRRAKDDREPYGPVLDLG